MRAAVGRELGALDAATGRLRGVRWIAVEAPSRPLRRLAIVAADAGNVQLRLAPLRVALVRVASSAAADPLGELVFDAGLRGDELAALARAEVPALVAPLDAAGIDLGAVLQRAARRPESVTALREALEWGALLEALGTGQEAPTLVVRDGLLRSIHLEAAEFARLAAAVRERQARTGNRVVAVAKRVPGGADLVNALLLGGVLDDAPDAALALLAIPESLERTLFPPAYASGRRMGPLLLARFRATGTFVPLEVPDADDDAVTDAAAALFGPDAAWFPEPGYPVEVTVAHHRARISALDREWFHRAFLDALGQQDPRLARRALAAEVLGRGGVGVGEDDR